MEIRNPVCLSELLAPEEGGSCGRREWRECSWRPLGPRGSSPSPAPFLSPRSVRRLPFFSPRSRPAAAAISTPAPGVRGHRGGEPAEAGGWGLLETGDQALACCVPPEQLRNNLLSVSVSLSPGLPLQSPLLALIKVQWLKVRTGTLPGPCT